MEPEVDSSTVLRIQDLVVEFNAENRTVAPVRGVSFDVRRGERIALVGESGSGKTLTALAMMRLVGPPGRIAQGRILLNGRDLLRLTEREMSQVRGAQIAMVYQNPLSALNPLHRIGDQVTEAIQVHQEMDGKAAKERAVSLLDQVGIPSPSQRFSNYPHQLSGGMRQRVVIAMAMCANPAVLIADEPTTALDVTTQARIIDLLGRLADEHQTAVILITHDLGVAADFCQEVRVMYAGRIVEGSTSEEFYRHAVHPYSEALLRSVLRKDIDVSRPIPAIEGQPPSPGRLPSACAFHPRCPYAVEICAVVAPPIVQLESARRRFAECHFAEDRHRGEGKGP